MSDVGIIFVHHAIGPSTANNLELVRALNPGVPVVTLSQEGETFPGGYNSAGFRDPAWRGYRRKWNEHGWRAGLLDRATSQRGFIWRNADLALYQWYTARRERAERWVVLEWDVLCTVGVREFYAGVWDADLAGVNVKTRRTTPEWRFFQADEVGKLAEAYRAHATGLTPLAGMMLSDRTLGAVAEAVRADFGLRDAFCELRLATVAAKLGFVARELGEAARRTLQDDFTFKAAEIQGPGIWHKVKDHHEQRFGHLLGRERAPA